MCKEWVNLEQTQVVSESNNSITEKGSEMLVLSRKVGERIWIGDEIAITVVRLTSGGVRIGIEAPNELAVVREELKQKIEAAEQLLNQPPIMAGEQNSADSTDQSAKKE